MGELHGAAWVALGVGAVLGDGLLPRLRRPAPSQPHRGSEAIQAPDKTMKSPVHVRSPREEQWPTKLSREQSRA